MNDDATERLADRIDAIAEELDELMFERLRAAAADKAGRPADDKRLLQARRALDKASRVLRGTSSDDDG